MTCDLTGLGRHLEGAYGVTVERMTPLEPWAPDGVQRVDLEGGDSWVMRVHGPARPVAEVHGDADLLRFLEQHDFPAERLARPKAVTTYGSMSVIVTKLLPGTNCRNDGSPSTINGVGRLLGRLHTLPQAAGAVSRPAGGWHHLSQGGGGRDEDVRVLLSELATASRRLPDTEHAASEELVRELEAIDLAVDLPHCLINVDFGGPNIIKCGETLSAIDWTGAGRGPRVQSLNTLGWGSHDPALVDAFVAGYREHVQLEPEELDRLGDALVIHGLVLQAWAVAFQGAMPSRVLHWLAAEREAVVAIVDRARKAFR